MKTIVICILILGTYSPAAFSQVDQFRSLEYRYTGGRYESSLFKYRMFFPSTVEAGKKYPLVVWLHGHGESGNDNKSQLAWIYSFMGFERNKEFPYFLLAMQCTKDNAFWVQGPEAFPNSDVDDKGGEMLAVLQNVVDKTLDEYAIDTNRIYLVGVCTGGEGCWEMAMRNPTRYAAISTLADYGKDYDRLDEIVDIPIWSFHSSEDSPEGIRRVFGKLKNLGGKCHLTEVPTANHNCWTTAFEDYNLREWLFSHDITNKNGRRPGDATWESMCNVIRRDYFHLEFFLTSILGPCVIVLYSFACLRGLRSQNNSITTR